MWYVYMIRSSQKRWYYVGSTNRLKKRMEEHGKGYVISTKSYKPFKLVYSKRFERETDARSFERKLKKDRVEKERIIRRIENM